MHADATIVWGIPANVCLDQGSYYAGPGTGCPGCTAGGHCCQQSSSKTIYQFPEAQCPTSNYSLILPSFNPINLCSDGVLTIIYQHARHQVNAILSEFHSTWIVHWFGAWLVQTSRRGNGALASGTSLLQPFEMRWDPEPRL
jgi:hypothetical protein